MSTEVRKSAEQPSIKWATGSGKSFAMMLPSLLSTQRPSYYTSDWGALFEGDCLEFLRSVKDSVVDTVFADPPFNLGKEYGLRSNDRRSDDEYFTWCQDLLRE